MAEQKSDKWKHNQISVNGINLNYVASGDGPLMLMLHGFPSFWYSWKYQIREFSKSYKTVAVDLRGYNKSDKPKSVSEYHLPILIQDIKELIEKLGEKQCILLGHDWGGGLAWSVANAYPEIISKLVVLNMPHPKILSKAILFPPQLLKTYYFYLFQIKNIPEILLSAQDFKQVRDIFEHETNNNSFSKSDIEKFIEAIKQPQALTSMINYYRNIFKSKGLFRQDWDILSMPTLLLMGENDSYFGKELTNGLDKYLQNYQVQYVQNGGHWLPFTNHTIVNKHIQEFI